MDETPAAASGLRRNEDIALDLMNLRYDHGLRADQFVRSRFQGSGAAAKPEEYAAHLLELYGKCLQSDCGKEVTGSSSIADLRFQIVLDASHMASGPSPRASYSLFRIARSRPRRKMSPVLKVD